MPKARRISAALPAGILSQNPHQPGGGVFGEQVEVAFSQLQYEVPIAPNEAVVGQLPTAVQ
jgi:hypothetical protein